MVLANSFLQNPAMKLMFGSNPTAEQLMRFNRWMARESRMRQLVAKDGERIIGALKYADHPHCIPRGTAVWKLFWDIAVSATWRTPFVLLISILDKDPDWHHRHLVVLGVATEFQSKGVGSALLERFLADADRDEVTTILETDTSRAVQLYSRFGFEVINESKFRKNRFWRMQRKSTKRLKEAVNAVQ